MAQPTPYSRHYNFTNYQTVHPADPLPAAQVDLEFNSVKLTVDQILQNLALIQRDDTALASASVGFDQLKAEVQTGINAIAPWLTTTVYVVGDAVAYLGKFYRCLVSHVSGVFATDLAAGKWVLIVDLTAYAFDMGDGVHNATETGSLVDNDELLVSASASSYATRKILWSNFKTQMFSQGGSAARTALGFGTKGAAIASAGTITLTDNYHHVTGSTTITDIDFTDAVDGRWAWLIFDGALTLTHNATTLKLPGGANITTAAGDRALFVQDATDNVICLSFVRATTAPDPLPTSGFRNKIINGDFDIWQRATSQTANGYGSDDRWFNGRTGSTCTFSRQTHALGQTDVPGNPKYYSRSVVTSVAGAGNNAYKSQNIEGVNTLAGKTATITFWAKADAAKNIGVELIQNFGSGGSPSAAVSTPLGLKALTTSWQKFSFTVAIPSISGKTLGTSGGILGLLFWFDAGSTWATRASSVGQQSGTFEISHVSIVEGDATAEDDPFSPRHIQQELALCQRYFIDVGAASSSGQSMGYGQVFSATSARMSVPVPVPLRASPTLVAASPTIKSNGATFTPSAWSVDGMTGGGTGNTVSLFATISGATGSHAAVISGSTADTFTFDAEL